MLPNSKRLAALGQITQEAEDLIAGLGHFGGQAQLGETGKTQQLGQFLTQIQNLLHDRAVVVFASVRALVRRAGAVRGVDFFAQGAVFGGGREWFSVVGVTEENRQLRVDTAMPGETFAPQQKSWKIGVRPAFPAQTVQQA